MSFTEFKKSEFSRFLVDINGLSKEGFSEWIFHPGMLFGSHQKWWEDDILDRPGPHEGLDFTCYRANNGNIKCISEIMKVPVLHRGIVKKISDDDFLGKSIYVTHPEISNQNGDLFHSIYAHSTPYENIYEGSILEAGDIVCTVVDFTKTKAKMIHHLHISAVFLPVDFSVQKMNWKTMANPEIVKLKDPLQYLDINFAIAEKISGIEFNRSL